MDAYTLKKHKETNELHLFKGEMTPQDKEHKCSSRQKSICRKMDKSENMGNVFSCATEQEARDQCAKLGRRVCGICVSDLYATYPD